MVERLQPLPEGTAYLRVSDVHEAVGGREATNRTGGSTAARMVNRATTRSVRIHLPSEPAEIRMLDQSDVLGTFSEVGIPDPLAARSLRIAREARATSPPGVPKQRIIRDEA